MSYVSLGQTGGLTESQRWREQLHAVALAIYQAAQRRDAARLRGDGAAVAAEDTNLANLRTAMQTVRAQFLAAMEREDPTALSLTDRLVLSLGSPLANSPGALAGLAKTLIGHVTGVAVTALLPLVGMALVVLWVLGRAERTRTYRRYVA